MDRSRLVQAVAKCQSAAKGTTGRPLEGILDSNVVTGKARRPKSLTALLLLLLLLLFVISHLYAGYMKQTIFSKVYNAEAICEYNLRYM
jgi:hypothetical protein